MPPADSYRLTAMRGLTPCLKEGACAALLVSATLYSQYGDIKKLGTDDYTVFSSAEETQIAVTYVHWPMTPVYAALQIDIAWTSLEASHTFDIKSVYVNEVQQGKGGVTQDGTVTAWSFYSTASAKSMTSSSSLGMLSTSSRHSRMDPMPTMQRIPPEHPTLQQTSPKRCLSTPADLMNATSSS